ncbi:hypothetical protein F4677DRAFT_274543 [Hypoxylon crocopeplum]|nr:hypothetical protein F4677DRAFT_274543 [Hypoxylon crocopeplum]
MHRRASESGPIKKKNSRSRNGCLTCRARKIKCDESPNGCVNCERIDVACPGYGSGQMKRHERNLLQSKNSSAITEAGIKRSRILRSCNGCRRAKTKCSGEGPTCLRCHHKNLPCVFEVSKSVKKDEGHDNQATADQQHEFNGIDHEYCSGINTPADSGHWPESIFPEDSSLYWLISPVLPDRARIRQLVDAYFVNVHPLRCLGFIHIPSFKQRLDLIDSSLNDLDRNALLYAVCAHGARFYALDCYHQTQSGLGYAVSAGRGWASRAHNIILGGDLNTVSVENLMATVLLHDYQLRVGNYANAFIVTGIAARMVQLLKINTEPSPGGPGVGLASTADTRTRESKRRLAWSCFTMETGLNGLEQLDMFGENDIKLQLPCNERNFIQGIPCITEVLQQGHIHDCVPQHTRPANAAQNMGLVAHSVRLAWLRKKVLNFAKTIDPTKPIATLAIEFGIVYTSLQQWHSSLPATLRLNNNTIYIRKETNQLPALFTIHLMYYSTICDLYGIGDRRLSYCSLRDGIPDRPSAEQVEFLTRCRKICFENAKEAARILTKAAQHGPKAFSDTWMLPGAFGIVRVLWCHITFPSDQSADAKRSMLEEVLPLLQGSMEALRLMRPLFSMAGRVFQAAIHLLMHAGLGPHLVQWMSIKDEPISGTEHDGLQTADFKTTESALHPLNVYNLAQTQVNESTGYQVAPPIILEADATIRQIESPLRPSEQHSYNQYGLIEPSGADDIDAISSQIAPAADLDMGGFAFDPMSFIQDDWIFEGMAEHPHNE